MVLLAGYFLAGKLGLRMAFVHANATAVWPPTGIALAGLLLAGYRLWPAVFLAAFLVNITTPGFLAGSVAGDAGGLLTTFLANISRAGSVMASLGIATGNTLEALVGAWLVNRFARGRDAFDQARSVFKFAILAGVVSTAVSASVGVTSLVLAGSASGSDFRSIWLT